jgi:hypothetical protein
MKYIKIFTPPIPLTKFIGPYLGVLYAVMEVQTVFVTFLFDLYGSLVTELYESDPSLALSSSALNKTTKNLSYQHGTNRVRNLITRQGHNP